jgi:hypothetical protein
MNTYLRSLLIASGTDHYDGPAGPESSIWPELDRMLTTGW